MHVGDGNSHRGRHKVVKDLVRSVVGILIDGGTLPASEGIGLDSGFDTEENFLLNKKTFENQIGILGEHKVTWIFVKINDPINQDKVAFWDKA